MHFRRVIHEPGHARRVVIIVIRERSSQRVHAGVATQTIIEEHAAITAGAAADILSNSVRWQAQVMHLFHVVAHVIHQREAEHRAISAGDEERFCSGARSHDARCGTGRNAHDG